MDILNFKKGENKYIKTVATPLDSNDIIVIISAKYEITDVNGEVRASGNFEISENNEMTMWYNATSSGVFKMTITVVVGAETHIDYAKIVVRE